MNLLPHSSQFMTLTEKVLSLYQTTDFRLVKIKHICRPENKCDLTRDILFGMARKHCGKRKCWLPAFSPFPTMFSKGLLFRLL